MIRKAYRKWRCLDNSPYTPFSPKSLRYLLLGRPKTFDELIDKIQDLKGEGVKPSCVNITFKIGVTGWAFPDAGEYRLEYEYDGMKVKELKTPKYGNNCLAKARAKDRIEHDALNGLYFALKRLKKHEIPATINGWSVGGEEKPGKRFLERLLKVEERYYSPRNILGA